MQHGTLVFTFPHTVELRDGLSGPLIARHHVPCYGPGTDIAAVVTSPGFLHCHHTLPDGDRVVYFADDRDRDALLYAWNLDVPDFSEWGDALFLWQALDHDAKGAA